MRDALLWCGVLAALVGHGLLWTGVASRLHGLKGPRPAIKGLTALCVAVFVGLPAWAAWQWRDSVAAVASGPAAGGPLAAYVWACAALGAGGLFVKPWLERRRHDRRVLAAWTQEPQEVARQLGRKPLAGTYARLLGALPGNEAGSLVVDRKTLIVPKLPMELDGLTIAHLSDLHLTGRIDRAYYGCLAAAVNHLRPDVVAVTGDIIENEQCRSWLDEALGRLCAPLGVYYVLGNHDAFIDLQQTRHQLDELGLCYLGGRCKRVEWNGASVLLTGNEQPWQAAPPAESLPTRSASGGEFRLALCHSPDQFAWCCRADMDLVLAGHTHGGQVQLPVLGVVLCPSLHGGKYACGVFCRGSTVMHVSRGLGGQTPLRWRCPPELALLSLQASPAVR